jgi:hypothetical protein
MTIPPSFVKKSLKFAEILNFSQDFCDNRSIFSHIFLYDEYTRHIQWRIQGGQQGAGAPPPNFSGAPPTWRPFWPVEQKKKVLNLILR